MKKFLFCISVTFLSILFTNSSKASHVAAADLYYEYVGPLQYKIHLVLYRDCKLPFPVGLSGIQAMHATSVSCNQDFIFTVDTNGNNTNHIYGNLCPNQQSWCQLATSIFPGYQEWHYTKVVTLPMACTDWQFRFDTLCCRNNAISNLVGPSGTGLCISAGLNNVARAVNNSPQLTEKPIPYVCVNQPNTFLNGPYDPDLDSLFFVPTQPLNSVNCNPINWAGTSYTANPFGTAAPGGYNVDPTTGTASFTPTATNTYVLAFTCYDIDKNTGDTVGYIMRDVQINVLNCNAAPPSSTNLTQSYQLLNVQGASLQSLNPIILNVCPGSQMSFDVQGVSNSGSNSILTYGNNALSCPGSTYIGNPIGGGNPVTGTFSWIPNALQIGTHTLIVQFVDSTCTAAQPIVLKSFCVIQINVMPGVDAGPDLPYCIGADSIQMAVTAPAGITQWSWTDINLNTSNIGLSSTTVKNPKAAPSVTTTYIVTAINPPAGLTCKVKDTITVNVFPGVTLDAGPNQTICANDSILLNGTVNPQIAPYTIRWRPAYNLSDTTILTPWASPLTSQRYKLLYTDNNGCKYTDSTLVTVDGIKAFLNSISSTNNICPGYPFQLFAVAAATQCGLSPFATCTSPEQTKQIGTSNIQQGLFSPFYTNVYDAYKTQFLYTAAELQLAGIRAGNINSLSWNVVSEASDDMQNVNFSMGCTSDTALSAATGFITGLSVVKDTAIYNSHLGWNEIVFEHPYYWDGVSNIAFQICYNSNSVATFQDVLASSITPNIQSMFQYQNAGGVGCNLAATSPQIGTVRPNTKFKFCESGSLNYSWTPSGSLDNSTISNPTSRGIGSSTDFVITVSSANCVSKDTVHMIVDNSNSVTATVTPQVLCEPGIVTLSATGNGTPPFYECGEENVNCIAPFNQYVTGVGNAGNLTFTPFSGNYAGGRSQMLYTIAELNALGVTKGRIDSLAFIVLSKNTTVGFNLAIRIGCTQLPDLTGGLIPSSSLKQVYTNSNYNTVLGVNSFPLNTPFVWDGVNNLVVELCFFNGANNSIGSDAVSYNNTVPIQFYMLNSTVAGCELPTVPTGGPAPSILQTIVRPNILFSICDIPVKTWQYNWSPSTYIYDSSAGVTTAYVDIGKTFYVRTKGGNKCYVVDSVSVSLSQHGVSLSPTDTTVCLGDAFVCTATGFGNASSETFFWYNYSTGLSNGLSCTTCNNPTITPVLTSDSVFVCVRTDSYNCNDTSYVRVNMSAIPNVTILNGDSITINYLQEVNLVATGASIYSWYPAWACSNPNVANTTVSPQEPTTYVVHGINQYGCGSYDSIKVNINYNDNVFVPSAFSPNGDNKNDVFNVVNLTFQKIQEFKIMNRWGQEIFNANDNKGWNGTFKGINQDPGVYYYLIKIAYPDGKSKIFKGDLTLIR